MIIQKTIKADSVNNNTNKMKDTCMYAEKISKLKGKYEAVKLHNIKKIMKQNRTKIITTSQ